MKIQTPAGLRMILKSSRVLERNPITMECFKHYSRKKTNCEKQGVASTEYQILEYQRGQ
jgi:hypothetical protein